MICVVWLSFPLTMTLQVIDRPLQPLQPINSYARGNVWLIEKVLLTGKVALVFQVTRHEHAVSAGANR